MGLFARLIVFVLVVMSLASLAITAERVLFFIKSKQDSQRYAQSLEKLLGAGNLVEAAKVRAGASGGYLGRVIEAGLGSFVRAQGGPPDYVSESVGRALERQAQREVQTLKRGQSVVATVSSTAPFVGLLGTVMGIVSSFQAMASTGSGGLGTVSAGIAEALVTTAFGLLVAIPAVFAFNGLQSWIDARAVDLSESSNELLDSVARVLRVGPGAGLGHAVAVPQTGSVPPPGHVGSVPPPGYGSPQT
jgi:biopolymer transport protein ExbB/TolQ